MIMVHQFLVNIILLLYLNVFLMMAQSLSNLYHDKIGLLINVLNYFVKKSIFLIHHYLNEDVYDIEFLMTEYYDTLEIIEKKILNEHHLKNLILKGLLNNLLLQEDELKL